MRVRIAKLTTAIAAAVAMTLACGAMAQTDKPRAPTDTREPTQTKDPTPPPLGTASFIPPEKMKEEPLRPHNFVVRAAIVNMAEMELGELALRRSNDGGVKQFARQMVQDHQQAQAKLRGVAATEKLALPGTVDEENRKLKQELTEIDPAKFDERYMQAMRDAHARALTLMDTASKSDQLPASLQGYAREVLANVRRHHETAMKWQPQK